MNPATESKSGWQLSGTAPEAYERYLVPALMKAYSRDLIERVSLERGQRVLDVACGTGVVARSAAERVGSAGKVTALDLNPGMLAVARRVSQSLLPPVAFVEGDATRMPLEDASFDAVLCQFGLMFFPDPEKALAEMRRVAAPGARLGVGVWRGLKRHVGWLRLTEAMDRTLGKDAGDVLRSAFVFDKLAELGRLVNQAGWNDVRVEIVSEPIRYPSIAELVRWEIESMPVPNLQTRMVDAAGAITADLEETLADHVDDYGIVFPSEALLVVARRAQ